MVREEMQQPERALGAARKCKVYLLAAIFAILLFVFIEGTVASFACITSAFPRTDLKFQLTQNPQFAVIRKTANGFPYYIPRYYFLQEKVTRFEVALLEVSVEAEYDTHFQRWYERALGMVGKDLFPDFKHFRQKTKALITDQADRDPQWIAAFLGEKTSDKKDLILRLVVEMSVEYQLRRLADIKNGVVFEVSVWHDRPYCITLHGLISKIGDLIILWHILNLARHLPLFIHDIEELWFFHWVRPLLSIEQDYVFGRIAR